MSTTQFIGILFCIALIYNGVVLFVYFKEDITALLRKRKIREAQDVAVVTPMADRPVKRELMGAVRHDDTSYGFSIKNSGGNEGIGLQSDVMGQRLDPDNKVVPFNVQGKRKSTGDNSFSIEDIERAMGDLNRAIENKTRTSELETDLFGQLSKNGSIKIAVNKGNRSLERELMALENTIVI